MGGFSVRNAQAIFERGLVSDYIRAEDYDNGIYMTDAGFSFLYECMPLPYAGDSTADILEQLYKIAPFTAPIYISVSLYASPNINNYIDSYLQRKNSGKTNIDDDAIKEMFYRRSEFYKAHTQKSFLRGQELRARDIRLFISVTVPLSKTQLLAPNTMSSVMRLKQEIESVLSQAGLFPHNCEPLRYIDLMREIINVDYNHKNVNYNPHQEIKSQIVYPDTKLSILSDGSLKINDKFHKVLSVKDYPPFIQMFNFSELYGAYNDNHRQIATPFMLTLSLKVDEDRKLREAFTKRKNYVTYQADGNPMTKYLPKLRESYEHHQLGTELYASGRIQTPMQLSIWVQGKDEDELAYMVKTIESIWAQKSFTLKPESDSTVFGMFLSILPLQYDQYVELFSKRSQSLFCNNAAHMSPVSCDWKGNATPMLSLISRKGQLIAFDPFVSDSNYNITVAATSGSGKSVIVQELVCAMLAEGGKAFVVDIGRSYEKICQTLGGEFIEFDPKKDIVINPFTHALADPDGSLLVDELDVLIPFFGAMLGIDLYMKDEKGIHESVKAMKYAAHLEMAITTGFKRKRNDTTVNDVIEELKLMREDSEEVRELITMLSPYALGGRFSKYLNGRDSFNYSKDFVVLELGGMEDTPQVRSLVLMMIFMRINQDVYKDGLEQFDEIGNKKPIRKKQLIVDEAWDLMKSGMTAAFIERAFRRFRKHNASAVVITQLITDFFETSSTRAIYTNSAWKIFLRQTPETIENAKKSNHLNMHDYFFDLMKSVTTVKGQYSEMMIMGELATAIGRFIMDRYSYYLYTTDANDKNKINEIMTRYNCNLKDAILKLIDMESK